MKRAGAGCADGRHLYARTNIDPPPLLLLSLHLLLVALLLTRPRSLTVRRYDKPRRVTKEGDTSS